MKNPEAVGREYRVCITPEIHDLEQVLEDAGVPPHYFKIEYVGEVPLPLYEDDDDATSDT